MIHKRVYAYQLCMLPTIFRKTEWCAGQRDVSPWIIYSLSDDVSPIMQSLSTNATYTPQP